MARPSSDSGTDGGLQPNVEYLLDAIPAFVWYKDKHNRIIRCNEAAAASMGATPAELERPRSSSASV